MREKKITGNFWSSDNESLVLPGEVIIREREIEVVLSDNITIPKGSLMNGNTSKGEDITIVPYSGFYEFLGGVRKSFFAKRVIKGIKIKSPEELKFNNYKIELSHLKIWAREGLLDFKSTESAYEIKLNKEPISYSGVIRDDLNMKLASYLSNLSFIDVFTGIKASYDTIISLEYQDRFAIDEVIEDVSSLQNFFSLIVDQPVYTIGFYAKYEDSFIKILDSTRSRFSSFEDNEKFRNHALISHKEITDNLFKYLESWFKDKKYYEPLRRLYFSTVFSESTYIEFRFLALVQAIESYHRKKYNGKLISETRKKEIFDKIESNFDEKESSLILENLKQVDEQNLYQRLAHLFDIYRKVLEMYTKKEKSFLLKVKNLRDYLTHYAGDKKEVKNIKKHELIDQLNVLIQCILLDEVGLSIDEIYQVFQDHPYHNTRIKG